MSGSSFSKENQVKTLAVLLLLSAPAYCDVYARVTRPTGVQLAVFKGVKQETVQAMLDADSIPVEFITEQQYLDAIAIEKADQEDPAKKNAKEVARAKDISDSKNSSKTPDQRIDALIKVLGL